MTCTSLSSCFPFLLLFFSFEHHRNGRRLRLCAQNNAIDQCAAHTHCGKEKNVVDGECRQRRRRQRQAVGFFFVFFFSLCLCVCVCVCLSAYTRRETWPKCIRNVIASMSLWRDEKMGSNLEDVVKTKTKEENADVRYDEVEKKMISTLINANGIEKKKE